jgi:predicted transcriptional regulator
LTRTLAKLEAAGFVRLEDSNHRKIPMAIIGKLKLEIDPFSQNDLLEIA